LPDPELSREHETAQSAIDSPVGPLIARADSVGVTHLLFARRGRAAQPVRGPAGAHRHIGRLETQLREYFDGTRRTFDVPFNPQGSPFYTRVWTALLDIPYGETISYGELAKRVGDPTAARAVGTANGANPIVILIPCHRVIGSDGKLVGYGGGLWRKRTLLDLESGRLPLVTV
jgi:O-6-methylguanine DNA methyltransferase